MPDVVVVSPETPVSHAPNWLLTLFAVILAPVWIPIVWTTNLVWIIPVYLVVEGLIG